MKVIPKTACIWANTESVIWLNEMQTFSVISYFLYKYNFSRKWKRFFNQVLSNFTLVDQLLKEVINERLLIRKWNVVELSVFLFCDHMAIVCSVVSVCLLWDIEKWNPLLCRSVSFLTVCSTYSYVYDLLGNSR